ncbi:MAG: excinuclease ABC subunit UvrA [Brachymonas sp.]|nr:excinuclease ABC subunit UvrA [Brachymonas sp.]
MKKSAAKIQPADQPAAPSTATPPQPPAQAAAPTPGSTHIVIRGARTHNLKNIDLAIPRNQLVVITGLSGSGKSSLAFDTLYAEGQRRYVESLSTYARQFLQMMDKPDVDWIEGLSPAISIEQKATSHNPRSTVGTVTEIHDYLRLLFARAGTPHCPDHGLPLQAQTVSQMVDAALALPAETRIMLLAPIARERKGEFADTLAQMQARGYVRFRIDGQVVDAADLPALEKNERHNIDVVIDRLKVRPDARQRLAESFEAALRLADGRAIVAEMDSGAEHLFNARYACPQCNYSISALEPRMFSFNAPQGACPECNGLGTIDAFDAGRVVAFPSLSLAAGAIKGWDARNEYYFALIKSLAQHYRFSVDAPFEDLPERVRHIILHGSGEEEIAFAYTFGSGAQAGKTVKKKHAFEGVLPNMARRYRETDSAVVREELARYRQTTPCPACAGSRLRREARHVLLGESEQQRAIYQVGQATLGDAKQYFDTLQLHGAKAEIADKVVREIAARLRFLVDVGLGYLTLDRSAETLSGGEAQRIRLASQIGSGLTGVMYVLDEPSIGLHQRDNDRLIGTLQRLRDMGNSVLVVEHDEDMIRAADHVVDMGPGAGVHGGQVMAQGDLQALLSAPQSLTGQYLSGRLGIAVPRKRTAWLPLAGAEASEAADQAERRSRSKKTAARASKQAAIKNVFEQHIAREQGDAQSAASEHAGLQKITIRGARGNNLQNVTVDVPVGLLTCVTGVSGSGKSTLINDTLYAAAAQAIHRAHTEPAPHDAIEGLEHFDKVINVDQSPIGRTPRSNPATYTGLFTHIRELMAEMPTAKERGYGPGRFSFNVAGGRCEACQGDGMVKVEMHFLPDVYVPCDICHGQRYNRETLEVQYKGKNIAEILRMTVEEALHFMQAVPPIARKLQTLMDVGLSYIQLGQSATTLSGGEAQRVKLAHELSRRDTGRTLYILDEPTTGLHFGDIALLLKVLHQLRDAGNTIVIIEHNLDVIKTADWLIDMGPEGGSGGGTVIAQGTPEQVARNPHSHTGRYLARLLPKE